MIGLELRRRVEMKQETPYETPVQTVNSAEFEERVANGEQLVILDDMVLDISDFKGDHPGGQFLIEHCIGRDIS